MIKVKLALENLDNRSWSLEGTAKSDSHGDRIALTSPNLTPPLFVIGSFCYHNALLEQKGSKSPT